MTSHPLAEDYFRWLAPQIREEHDPNRTHWGLVQIMHEKEYAQDRLVHNDHNRLKDGLALRTRFCYAHHIHPGSLSDLGPCSFLEVLIGLSHRMAFDLGGSPPGWAWCLVLNLELDKLADPVGERKASKIHTILDRCIHRDYAPDGFGGFFPLAWPNEDQRYVEIWYQMAAWINERHPEH